MDSREVVSWVLLVSVAVLVLFGANGFVNAVQYEIAEGSVPMVGSYLDSATDTTLSQFILFGQVGRALIGLIVLAALGGMLTRLLSLRKVSA